MQRKIDMTGQRFKRLTVIERTEETWGSSAVLICLCDCGEKIKTTRQHLLTGRSKSCGCLTKDRIITKTRRDIKCIDRRLNDDVVLECYCGNLFVRQRSEFISRSIESCGCFVVTGHKLHGKTYGRLTVVKPITVDPVKGTIWQCTCECGNSKEASTQELNRKQVQSCGCLHRDRARTHLQSAKRRKSGRGIARREGEVSWQAARQRIRKDRGTAREHKCSCGADAEFWVYMRNDPHEIEIPYGKGTMKYSVEPKFYDPLCKTCRAEHNKEMKNG